MGRFREGILAGKPVAEAARRAGMPGAVFGDAGAVVGGGGGGIGGFV